MWNVKTWKLDDKERYQAWLTRHHERFEIVHLFINNGYGVQYRQYRKAI